ncbi:hypothetical protein KC19_3G003800 [Ceratodon purpureus]|uniref:C2HC/C3H-type domain-containing protein n=1 Tax=Ceratodon purpureus TaxID=3225 RepID=A0A8T0IFE4_CERPU|nr:hypothetical protein KC19_3G003800 [Ceratodon purpureus]
MESGLTCRLGNRPRMLICYLCGREYGSRSLNIHIPQCQKKWLLEEEKKPRNERRPLPPRPNAEKAIRNGGAQAFDSFNVEAFAAFEQTLQQCPYCQRRFEAKSYLRHQKGCTAAKPAKPAGTGLIKYSLTNRLVPGAVAGSMHGKAKTQPLPLRFCRPPPKLKPKLKSTARPAWTGAGGPSFDDMEENPIPVVRPKPSKLEWCLQAETRSSSKPASNRGQSSHMSSSFCMEPARTRNRVPDSRTASFNGNSLRSSGGDNSHLVSTFGDLWRTHKDSNDVPQLARHKSNISHAQEWCSQTDQKSTSMPSRRSTALNPKMHKSQAFSSSQMNRQSPSSALRSSQTGRPKFTH